ncbi:Armadillo-type fold [Pseudocohnilembus persalinus]|uniref:Armadillo-type fold n=1 Tax=Pseudocohnilembus persalinus TaxID=266149 RepID=A0A0V0QW72_PSEPJ|nr:Armadillo-type fold [Pseudocohnilembus persalinus]|eukprot:KRX06659.1 Armadillo-type fold [Pseudocohnilembus persalinus]
MLAKENSWIPFHVAACNSQENGTDIQLLSTAREASYKSWECKKNTKFPIEIIIRFHYRAEINHVLLSSKTDKNIPRIEFYIGDGLSGSFLDAEYRLAGYYTNINNKAVQIPLQGIGNYLKILITEQPKSSQQNPHKQVSLAFLKIWGRHTNYVNKIFNHEIPMQSEQKDNIDKILIDQGIPIDLMNWYHEDCRQWEHAPIDNDTKITLEDLEKLKQQALVEQDFEMLKALTKDIKKIFDLGIEIQKLERELQFALSKEDYDRATELKKRLKNLKQQRDGYDALYETSRYEGMVSNVRPSTAEYNQMIRLMDEEAERERLRNQKREPTPQQPPQPDRPVSERFSEDLNQEDDNDRKIKGAGDDVPWWEKTQGQDMKNKFKKKKEVIKKVDDDQLSKFNNPFVFNEGDVDLELYFKPLISQTGGTVEDVPAEILRRLYNLGYLTVFGAKVWTAIHSENWRHREAAAQAVLNFIEMPLPEKYLNGNSRLLFLACMELSKLAVEDKILSIYFIGLKILSTALSPPVCGTDVSPKLINQCLKEFIPLFLEKIAELNFRSRDITMHTLLSVFKHPAVQVGELIKQALKICIEDPKFASLYVPPDKQPERVIKARLEVILSIVQEQGINEKEWQWTDVFIYLCVPSLFHPSNEVRLLSIELIIAMYLVIGEDVRNTLVDIDLKPNIYEMIITRMNDVREQAIENQKIREEQRGQLLLEEQEQLEEQKLSMEKSRVMNNKSAALKKKKQMEEQEELRQQMEEIQRQKEENGIIFSLDCIVKSKVQNKPIASLISINPPASYYQDMMLVDDSVKLMVNVDFSSHKEYPHYNNTYVEFYNVAPQGCVIVDLKYLESLEKKVLYDYGWAIMPLFQENGEMNAGEYQLPLFKPPIDRDVILKITSQPNQKEYLDKLLQDKKSGVKLLEWSSVIVRLNEYNNRGQTRYDFQNISKKFLPEKNKEKLQFTLKQYNDMEKEKAKKPLGKIIPSNIKEEDYQRDIMATFEFMTKVTPVEAWKN